MTSYFQKMVENTMAVTLRNWGVGGRGNVHDEENHISFSGLVLNHCPARFQLVHIAFFQVKPNQTKPEKRKNFWMHHPLVNEKAHFFFFF